MDLMKLNIVAGKQYLPKKAILDLTVGESYQVTSLKQVNTSWGIKSVITIDNEFQVFLPPRIHALFVEDKQLLVNLQQQIEENKLHIKHLGECCLEFTLHYGFYNPLEDFKNGFNSN